MKMLYSYKILIQTNFLEYDKILYKIIIKINSWKVDGIFFYILYIYNNITSMYCAATMLKFKYHSSIFHETFDKIFKITSTRK